MRGQMRLVVPLEQRFRADDVRPLGEPPPPPVVVFGNRVKLRQVEGKRTCAPSLVVRTHVEASGNRVLGDLNPELFVRGRTISARPFTLCLQCTARRIEKGAS